MCLAALTKGPWLKSVPCYTFSTSKTKFLYTSMAGLPAGQFEKSGEFNENAPQPPIKLKTH